MDIHSLPNRFYFKDSVKVRLESCIPLLLQRLPVAAEDRPVIAFPDEGASKRFSHFFSRDRKLICGKTRVNDQRIVTIHEGSEYLQGNDVRWRWCFVCLGSLLIHDVRFDDIDTMDTYGMLMWIMVGIDHWWFSHVGRDTSWMWTVTLIKRMSFRVSVCDTCCVSHGFVEVGIARRCCCCGC